MLDQQDINGLLTALTAAEADYGMEDSVFHEVKIYDFARPDNLPSEFIRTLENINLTFARGFSGILTGFLSEEAQIEAFSIEQITFRHLCNEMPERTTLCTFTISPLEGVALFEMNPQIAFYLLDRGLGGAGQVDSSPREFTPLEKGLLDDLFRRIVQELGRAWDVLVPMRANMREVVSNAMLTRAAHAEDHMVVSTFAITMGAVSGMATYAIPFNSLDFDRLLSVDQSWSGDDEALLGQRDQQQLNANIQLTPMPVRACLHDQRVTLGMLATLREGDVVELDAEVTDPVEVRVANRTVFLGTTIRQRDIVAVEIHGPATVD